MGRTRIKQSLTKKRRTELALLRRRRLHLHFPAACSSCGTRKTSPQDHLLDIGWKLFFNEPSSIPHSPTKMTCPDCLTTHERGDT